MCLLFTRHQLLIHLFGCVSVSDQTVSTKYIKLKLVLAFKTVRNGGFSPLFNKSRSHGPHTIDPIQGASRLSVVEQPASAAETTTPLLWLQAPDLVAFGFLAIDSQDATTTFIKLYLFYFRRRPAIVFHPRRLQQWIQYVVVAFPFITPSPVPWFYF